MEKRHFRRDESLAAGHAVVLVVHDLAGEDCRSRNQTYPQPPCPMARPKDSGLRARSVALPAGGHISPTPPAAHYSQLHAPRFRQTRNLGAPALPTMLFCCGHEQKMPYFSWAHGTNAMKLTPRNTLFLLFIAILYVSCAAFGHAKPQSATPQWVGSWAASQQIPESGNALDPNDLHDATLRQIVHLSVGGKTLRVHLSNAFGITLFGR